MRNRIIFGTILLFCGQVWAGEESSFMQVPPAQMTSNASKPFHGEVASAIQSCNKAAKAAHYACLANLSPKIQTAGVVVSGILAMVKAGKASSSSDGCSKYNTAMDVAEKAILAYNTACTAAMAYCDSSCGKSLGSNEKSTEALAGLMKANPSEAGVIQADIESVQTSNTSIKKHIKTCEGYKMNLAAAAIGLVGTITQAQKQSQCENKTTVADCTKDPQNPQCKKGIDCSIEANKNDTQCICQRAPTTAGCPGYNSNLAGGQAPQGPSSPGSDVNPPTDKDFGGGMNMGGTDMGSLGGRGFGGGGNPSGLGGPGGGSGGGGGLAGGGGGGNSAGNGADGKANSKGFNPNILSGFDGGGGGGGRGGGSGRPDSAYNAYLPGGAKDPQRSPASQTFGQGQVTTSGAKTNWQKVNDRFSDIKPTLLGR